MKITKSQLRRIIKEEKQKLNEMDQEYRQGTLVSVNVPEYSEKEENFAKKSLLSIWQEATDFAVDELGLDFEESGAAGTRILIDILADVLDSVGDTQMSHELRRFVDE
jgi:hypothetical protein